MISIFTPSHDPRYLDEALSRLKAQTVADWEWVVLLNGGATWASQDPRVKVVIDRNGVSNVGYLKRAACSRASGSILLEMDHDDWLFPTAIEEVERAFFDPKTTFVYSNSVNHDERSNQPVTWSEQFGWSARKLQFEGRELLESVQSEPHPQSISRIWFAPNHLRAWRADAYWEIGGHNGGMKISDDHDLMMRTWLHGKMVHIDKPLYYYRIHGDNTWMKNSDEIQSTMWQIHDRYIEQMALRWAADSELRTIDICAGKVARPGFEGVDSQYGPIVADLDERWPFDDDSVGVIRAQDALEHLRNPIMTMNEAWRVLAHGGFLFVAVPSTDGPGAWSDPTHVSFWNRHSFDYYTNPKMRQYLEPAAQCKFQAIKVVDGTQTNACGQTMPYVFAHLAAIKQQSPRFYGELLWQ